MRNTELFSPVKVRRAFEAVLTADVNHQGARIHLQMIEELGEYE